MLAGALGLTAAATLLLVAGGVLAALPSAVGLPLFALLVGLLERRVAVHHPHARLGLANRITLVRTAVAFLIACRALEFTAPRPDRTLGAERACRHGIAARWRRRLGGAPAGIGLGVRRSLRSGGRCLSILALAVVVVESGAVRAVGAGDRRDALSLSRHRPAGTGVARAAAAQPILRSPPQDHRGGAEHRADLCACCRRRRRSGPALPAPWRWRCSSIRLPPTSPCCYRCAPIRSRSKDCPPTPHMMRGGKEKNVARVRVRPPGAAAAPSRSQPGNVHALGEAVTALRRGDAGADPGSERGGAGRRGRAGQQGQSRPPAADLPVDRRASS